MLVMAPTNTTVRRLPQHTLVKRLRKAGYTQFEFAQRCKVSQQTVSAAIGRRVKGSPMTERVWAELEKVLGNGSADAEKAPAEPDHVA